MFIHRPEMTPDGKSEGDETIKKDEAEIIVAKNRSGERGSFKLVFKGEKSKFINISFNEPKEPGPSDPFINSTIEPDDQDFYDYTPSEEDIPSEDELQY